MNAKPANILGVVILVVSISWAIFWGWAAISNNTLEPMMREGPIVLWGSVMAALLLRNRKEFALYIAIATIFLLTYQAYLFDRELRLPLFTESTMPIVKSWNTKYLCSGQHSRLDRCEFFTKCSSCTSCSRL